MVVTVTFNPSIDYHAKVNSFRAGKLNRNVSEEMYPGGKGINVSMVCRELGLQTKALGFIAGYTGNEIARMLSEKGIQTDFVVLGNGISRINVKIHSDSETEINGRGPQIDKEELRKFFNKLENLDENDYLVLAGAVPNGVSEEVYAEICESLVKKHIRIIVDASGDLLRSTLEFHPFMIKPNIDELGQLFNRRISSVEEVVRYARILHDDGAQNVLVSMGGEGAVLIDETGREFIAKAPTGQAVNTIGAGDSMVAGFIAGYEKTADYEQALRYGVAAGTATAFNMEMCTEKQVLELEQKIRMV